MPKTATFDQEQVLQKVTDLFWDKGYSATSMQDIVDASGLNRSSIYNSFGDKHQLFIAAIEYYQNSIQSANLKDLANLAPHEAIRHLFEGVLEAIDLNTNQKGCFMTNSTAELAAHDKNIHALLMRNMDDLLNLFKDILTKGQQNGEFDPGMEVERTALYLFSSIQGIRVTGILLDSKTKMQALIDRTLEKI